MPKLQNDASPSAHGVCWGYAYEKLALMLAGGHEQPTVEAFLLELPAQELPA